MKIETLVTYLDRLLKIDAIEDSSINGLQVAGPSIVNSMAFSVDATLDVFRKAKDYDLLMVHHGILWSKTALKGLVYKRVKALYDYRLGLYVAHLPLDMHPQYGNNATLARIISMKVKGTFHMYAKAEIALWGTLNKDVLQIKQLIDKGLGTTSTLHPFGQQKIKKVGLVTGYAPQAIEEAWALGCDLFITGETSHIGYSVAKDLGINVIFAGHYKTEILGVQQLQKHLKKKFGLKTAFIDSPTNY